MFYAQGTLEVRYRYSKDTLTWCFRFPSECTSCSWPLHQDFQPISVAEGELHAFRTSRTGVSASLSSGTQDEQPSSRDLGCSCPLGCIHPGQHNRVWAFLPPRTEPPLIFLCSCFWWSRIHNTTLTHANSFCDQLTLPNRKTLLYSQTRQWFIDLLFNRWII